MATIRTILSTMRDLMQIVEATSGTAADVVRQQFRNAAWAAFTDNLAENEWELEDLVGDFEAETGATVPYSPHRGGELSFKPFHDWCERTIGQRADACAASLLNNLRGNSLRAWRAIEAPPTWQPEPPNPGVHWSRTREKAQVIFGDGDPNHVVWLIEADIPLASVDWYLTVKANMSEEFGSDEDEIRILDDAPVLIRSARPVKRRLPTGSKN